MSNMAASVLSARSGEFSDPKHANRTEFSFLLAAATLCLFDILLTFPRELRCIWQRAFSAITCLYPIIRYCALGAVITRMIPILWISMDLFSCRTLRITGDIFDISLCLGVAVFNCLRVWSVCDRKLWRAAIVFMLGMCSPVLNTYGMSVTKSFEVDPVLGCKEIMRYTVYIYLPVIIRAIAIMADCSVLFFTLIQTVSIYRARRELYGESSVVTVLVRNGSVQFIILVIINFANMLRDLSTDTLASRFVYINAVTTSILLSRFILDLRTVYLKPQYSIRNGNGSNRVVSTIDFASWVGNIGASLDVPWADEQSEELDEDEDDTLYSDTPLAVGLFDPDGVKEGDINCGQ